MPAFLELGSLLMVTALAAGGSAGRSADLFAALAAADGARRGARQRQGPALFLFDRNRLHAARDGFSSEADSVSRPSDIFGSGRYRCVSRICRHRKPFKRTLGSAGIFSSARSGFWVAAAGCLYLVWLDPWLALTQSWVLAPRFSHGDPDHRAIGAGHGAFISDGAAPGQRSRSRTGALVLGGQWFCLGARNGQRALAGHVHRVFKIDPGSPGLLFGGRGALLPVATEVGRAPPLKAGKKNSKFENRTSDSQSSVINPPHLINAKTGFLPSDPCHLAADIDRLHRATGVSTPVRPT